MILPVEIPDSTDCNAPPLQRALSPLAASSVPAEADETIKGPDVNDVPAPAEENHQADASQSGIEPSLLITIPVVCHAIREGWVEKESLIFGKKDAYNNVIWKKPIEILKDRDEDGIRNILNTIGQERVVEFMKKEGLSRSSRLSAEDIILGRGYLVDKGRLIALYDKHVGTMCDELFPFSLGHIGIAKGRQGFEITSGKGGLKVTDRTAEAEWMMPNLANLPIRLAIEKLSVHTSRIKVHGNGRVTNQSPRAFERLTGEPECVIQGKAENE
ncbi:MAG: hypothetical protein ABSC19_03590 [Syntrophorhabdales bacterium]